MSVYAACRPIDRCLSTPAPFTAVSAAQECVETKDFRQLRHLTKNALQRILAVIAKDSALHGTAAGRVMSGDLQRRILTTARLSDALFGFTQLPGSLGDRLLDMSEGLIDLLSEDAATIRVALSVQCTAAAPMNDLLVRVAHELVGNAIKHGMHQRLLGEIAIKVGEEQGQIILTVADDGWGPERNAEIGQGLSIVDALLRPVHGSCQLRRDGRSTVVRVCIPGADRTA